MPPSHPRPARSLQRLPTRLPRTAIPWWIAVVALALLTAATVHGTVRRAAAAESRWRARPIVVATRSLAVGDPLDGAVVLRRVPAVGLPRHTLAALPHGRFAMAPIDAGEVVSAIRVSGRGATGAAATLPTGTRAVAVPLAAPGPSMEAGDRVDLLASGRDGVPTADDAPVPAPVARRALVVSASASSLVVAVPAADAPGLAAALGRGPLVPALVAPGP